MALIGSALPARALLGDDAVFVWQAAPPSEMFVSQTAKVAVTMRNTGSNTWTQLGAYILVPVNPQANTNWSTTNVQLAASDSVATNQQHTFVFTVTTPSTPGTYVFRWQMLHFVYGTSFGALTPEVVVHVRAAGCSVSHFTIAADSDEESFQRQSSGGWPPSGTITQLDDRVVSQEQRSLSGSTATVAVTSARWLTGNTIPASATVNGASLGIFLGAKSSANSLNFAGDWVTANDNAPSTADYVQNLSRSAFGTASSQSVAAQNLASGAAANAYFQLSNPSTNVDRAANGWTKIIFGIMPSSGSAAPTGLNYHIGRSAEVADDNNEGAPTLDVYWCLPSPTWTPVPTRTPVPTDPATMTATATPTAEPNCHYATFRVTSGDDGYMSKIDSADGWPPAGGNGLVDSSQPVTILAEGASNVNAAYVRGDGTLSWPEVLYLDSLSASPSTWDVWNLAVNNQTAVNMTPLVQPPYPWYTLPWVEIENHRFCSSGNETHGQPGRITGAVLCTSDSDCPSGHTCTGGGATGVATDVAARSPDAVILTPESNDARWPWLYPDQLAVSAQDIVDALERQCDLVTSGSATCIVPTMHKPPYVADVPSTSQFITQVNTVLRNTFPNDHVVDFDTDSSNLEDYPLTGLGDFGHIGGRLHNKRASRVLATLTQTTFSDTAPILEVETRRWNSTSGRSVAFVRFFTDSLPDDAEVRSATLEVFSTYTGAPGAGFAIRNIGIGWANAAADDGWSMADWPATVTADAFNATYPTSSALTVSEWRARSFDWSFALIHPETVSLTGYTGLFIFMNPDSRPDHNDEYFTTDLVSFDSLTGPEPDGDQAPKLTVYYCTP